MSITETLDSVKLAVRSARQQAYLGFYEESIKCFNKALEGIRRHYKSLDEQDLVNEWKNTEKNLFNEMSIVNDLKNIVQGLKNDPGKDPIAAANYGANYGGNNYGADQRKPKSYDDEMNDDNNYVQQKQQQPRYPFDEKPFSYKDRRQERQDSMDEENKYQSDKPHYIYVKQPQSRQNQRDQRDQKDPDVWDPPSPKEAKRVKPTKKVEPAKGKPTSNKPGDNKGPSDKRNYEKPWQVPEKEKKTNQSGNAAGGAEGDKKSFLLHHYPDGKGPDAELIQMLERDVVDTNPNIKFEDIASLDQAKQLLQEAVLLPLLCPELFIGIRKPWSGVLMFGPPGTGKTLLAKAVATQGKTTFFNITAASLASKWRGESERLVRMLFEMARFHAPTTIFFDEIDALGSKRGGSGEHETSRRVLSELLIQMDGMNSVSPSVNEQGVEEPRKTLTVIGATNRPWDLDEALRRRLEKRIYIPLPTPEGRRELFTINLKGIKLADNVNFEELVKKTDGYSGADIAALCREAAMMPIRKKLIQGGGILNQMNNIDKLKSEMDVPITHDDFLVAIKNVQKSVSDTDLNNYVQWMAEFGSS